MFELRAVETEEDNWRLQNSLGLGNKQVKYNNYLKKRLMTQIGTKTLALLLVNLNWKIIIWTQNPNGLASYSLLPS